MLAGDRDGGLGAVRGGQRRAPGVHQLEGGGGGWLPHEEHPALLASQLDRHPDPLLSGRVVAAQEDDPGRSAGDIDISSITAGIDANIRALIARGSIRLRDIKAQGTVNIVGVATVAPPPGRDPNLKNS